MNNPKRKRRKFNLHTIYLGINLAKEVQILYTEKYKRLFREILKDLKKWKEVMILEIHVFKGPVLIELGMVVPALAIC